MTAETALTAPEPVRLGQFIESYQVIGQAPVEFIHGSRQRAFEGHLITGWWSDPWWLYCPVHGWAVVKRWKNKDTNIQDWEGGRFIRSRIFPAREELVIEPYGETSA